MDNWQVGDLALCVTSPDYSVVAPGAVCSVSEIVVGKTGATQGLTGLLFTEIPTPPGYLAYDARAWRKINPLSDEEREEFTAELNAPVRERAALGECGA